jgi:hypothetical protein
MSRWNRSYVKVESLFARFWPVVFGRREAEVLCLELWFGIADNGVRYA